MQGPQMLVDRRGGGAESGGQLGGGRQGREVDEQPGPDNAELSGAGSTWAWNPDLSK